MCLHRSTHWKNALIHNEFEPNVINEIILSAPEQRKCFGLFLMVIVYNNYFTRFINHHTFISSGYVLRLIIICIPCTSCFRIVKFHIELCYNFAFQLRCDL